MRLPFLSLNLALAAVALMGYLSRSTAAAQSTAVKAKPAFDISRLRSEGSDRFETFYVKETKALRQALSAGIVKEDTRVLVTETAAGNLALLTDQMAFHHIAEGRAGGKDWMVTF